MEFDKFLEENKEIIREKWYLNISETYKDTSGRFFMNNRDKQFSNPVAWTFSTDIPIILNEIISGKNSDELNKSLENLVRIRAVQDFSPSQSISFILTLKKIVRELLGIRIEEKAIREQFYQFEMKVDATMLLCFDIYNSMREKLLEIKMNEVKRRYDGFLKRFEKKYGEMNDII